MNGAQAADAAAGETGTMPDRTLRLGRILGVAALLTWVATAGVAQQERPLVIGDPGPAPGQVMGDAAGLQPGDLVFVDVHRRPELSTTTQVDMHGNIALPYVGTVKVGGLAEPEASARVGEAFKRILRNPRVTVSRTEPGITAGFRTSEMRTELISLQNADAENLTDALQGMTSPGGTISYDPDTYTLIITDTPAAIKNITSVVMRLDRMQSQLSQVRIDAKIAEVRVGAARELGIRWFLQSEESAFGYYPLASQTAGLGRLKGGFGDPTLNEDVSAGGGGGGGGGREFIEEGIFERRVSLPVTIPKPGQLFFGWVNNDIDLGTLLDALVADDDAQLLAAPSILTKNHKTARIKSVENFPYTEYGVQSGRTTFGTEFIELGIELEVTPHIKRDEAGQYVQLELKPSVSFPTGSTQGVPIKSERMSESIALVRSGQTLVIGGIYRNEGHKVTTGIPGLSKLPLVGNAFKHTENVKEQTELMVFVTPTVHETPDTITWDRMLNVTTARDVLDQVPSRPAVREERRE
jgi:type IV pilus assembly protein PilQ